MRLEALEAVSSPSRILEGKAGELFAVRETIEGKQLVVVYRELENDGFIITAFITSKTNVLNRRNQVWPK